MPFHGAAPEKRFSKSVVDFRPTIVLTFDDGFESHYDPVFDILEDNDLVGSFFVCGSGAYAIDTAGYMTAANIREMYAHGNEIGNHSYTHANLPPLTRREMLTEISRNYTMLAGWGLNPVSFAYPFGEVSHYVADIVSSYHRCARVTGGALGHALSYPQPRNFYVPSIFLGTLTNDMLDELIAKRAVLTLLYHDLPAPAAAFRTLCERISSRLDDIDCRTLGDVFGGRDVGPLPNCINDLNQGVTTTNAYESYSLYTARMNEVSILLRNRDAANTVTYRIVGFFSHFCSYDRVLVADSDLSPLASEYYFPEEWYEVIEVQVKSTVPDSHADITLEIGGL